VVALCNTLLPVYVCEIRGPSFSSRCDSKVYNVSFRSMGIIWGWGQIHLQYFIIPMIFFFFATELRFLITMVNSAPPPVLIAKLCLCLWAYMHLLQQLICWWKTIHNKHKVTSHLSQYMDRHWHETQLINKLCGIIDTWSFISSNYVLMWLPLAAWWMSYL